MRRLELRKISIEKQMTIFLPLAMSLMVLIGILTVNRLRQAEAVNGGEGQQLSEMTEPSISDAEPVCVLLILHEQEELFLSRLQIDPKAGQVMIDPVTVSSEMREVYRNGGAAVLREKLAAEQNTVLDYYADITFEGLWAMLQHYGEGAVVTFAHAVEYKDAAGLFVSFPAGKVRLSANQLPDLLRALGKEKDGAQTVAALHADLFDRYVDETKKPADIYAVFAENADTDIRIYDYEKHLPVMQVFAARKPN